MFPTDDCVCSFQRTFLEMLDALARYRLYARVVAAVVPVASLCSMSAESNAVKRVCFAGGLSKEGGVGETRRGKTADVGCLTLCSLASYCCTAAVAAGVTAVDRTERMCLRKCGVVVPICSSGTKWVLL